MWLLIRDLGLASLDAGPSIACRQHPDLRAFCSGAQQTSLRQCWGGRGWGGRQGNVTGQEAPQCGGRDGHCLAQPLPLELKIHCWACGLCIPSFGRYWLHIRSGPDLVPGVGDAAVNEVLSSTKEQILSLLRANPRILTSVTFTLGGSVLVSPSREDSLPSPSSCMLCLLMEKVESDKSGLNPSSGSCDCACGHLTLCF